MSTFNDQVNQIAGSYGKAAPSAANSVPVTVVTTTQVPATPTKKAPTMTSPIAVAGLADTINSAIAGMARANAAAQALNTSAQKLVGNIASVESLQQQLDDANSKVEAAITSVGLPLPATETGAGTATPAAGVPNEATSSAPAPQAASLSAAHAPTQQASAINTAAAQAAAANASHAAASPTTTGVATAPAKG